jgi:hypothetical protein
MEKWKSLDRPFEKYEISTLGRLKNSKTNYIFKKDSNVSCGYSRVRLTSSDGKDKYIVLHKLVADAFIPNPNNKLEINHKNGIRNDNRASNLEWVTRKENCNRKNQTNNKSRPVMQYDLDGNFIKKWDKISDIPFGGKNISSACAGRLGHAYGFVWKYYEEKIRNEDWKVVIIKGKKIEVSNKGRIRLVSGKVTYGYLNDNGYRMVNINKKTFQVHRLVAKTFVPNNQVNKNVVDHIDGNRENNSIDNLRWVSNSENRMNTKKVKRDVRKVRVIQIFMDGKEAVFESIEDASIKTGNSKGNICMVCRGQRKTTGGCKWKYAE